MPTANGVYYNLHESKYSITLFGIEYFFSSEFYLSKFKKEYVDNRYLICGNMSSPMFNQIKILCDCALYNSIEKRGWLVLINGGSVTWQEILKYVGVSVTKMMSKD